MRTEIPDNNVSIDYKNILDNFITSLVNKQKNNLISVYMNGSYARGDATDLSDLDIFCIFAHLDNNVLNDVGDTTRNTTILFGKFEINSQCFSLNEIEDPSFINWREKSVRILDSVLLYGEDLFGNEVSVDELESIYKRYLVDVLMSIRHYICVDKAKENLTYHKLKTYILKPLMFPLRMEHYLLTGYFPLTIDDLYNACVDNKRLSIEYFRNQEKLDNDIKTNHKLVLEKMQSLVLSMLNM